MVRFGSQLSLTYRIEAEKFKGVAISRVYFEGQPETNDYVEDDMSVQKMDSANDQSCASQTVYIRVSLSHYRLGYQFVTPS